VIFGKEAEGNKLSHSVFGRFGHTELDHSFSRDLDLRASRWVATHTSLALDFHQFTNARNDKFAVLSDLFVGQTGHFVQDIVDSFFAKVAILSQTINQLSLCHRHRCNDLLPGSKSAILIILYTFAKNLTSAKQ